VIRVVLTGSESTGKTTLAGRLAAHYGVNVVPEFVRDFAAARGGVIEFGDHGAIARGQMALEDEYAARGGRVLVQDTDLLSTMVYCRHYFGRCPAWIEEKVVERRPDLYLLCEPDIPWIADGVRDRGHMRGEMQALFRAAVKESGALSVTIRGNDLDVRVRSAVEVVNELLNHPTNA
jgi:NadR type nicotinamide-nucleotide adenylyltransferase